MIGLAESTLGAGPSGSMRSVRYRLKILLSALIPKNTFSWSSFTWGWAQRTLYPPPDPPPPSQPLAQPLHLRHRPRPPSGPLPGPRLHQGPLRAAHLVPEALGLQLLQELPLPVDLAGVPLGAVIGHQDVVRQGLVGAIRLQEGGVGWAWGVGRRGPSPEGLSRDSPQERPCPSAGNSPLPSPPGSGISLHPGAVGWKWGGGEGLSLSPQRGFKHHGGSPNWFGSGS